MVTLALATCVPMGWWSAQLFGNLRADVKELLPENARSVVTLRALERRFGGFSQLSMLVESPDREANRRFSDALVARLEKHGSVRSIRNKLGAEREFFEARRFLFIDTSDLELVLERLEDAAHDARVRANPLLVELDDSGPVKLDFSDIEKKYAAKMSLATRFPDGYFESKDGTQLAILLRKHGLAFGVEANQALVADVEAAVRELGPERYHPSLRISLGGDVKNLIEEHESLLEDLVLATAIVFSFLGLVVVLYYRRFRALYLIGVPVIVGCAWTFGVSWFAIGYLNASSAFLGPIIPGNGMNFGLILLARYFEERRAGVALEPAVDAAVRFTAKATSLVAVVASIAYGSLMVTDFLGFKHFGIIGGIGMLFCWVATFVVLPSLIVWVERHSPLEAKKELSFVRPGLLASLPVRIVGSAPHLFAWSGILVAIAGLTVGALYLRDPFEKDFTKLRSTTSLTGGSAATAAKVDAIFGMYQEPQVIVAEREEDVPAIVAALEKVIAEGERAPLTEVSALATLVPRDQEAKLAVLAEIRRVLSDDLLSNLDEEQRKLAERHRPPADLAAFGPKDLPESVRADFREVDGTEGRVVLALPNIHLNLYDADEIQRVADALRRIELPDGRVVESSGNFVIYSDMVAAVAHDGPKATAYSFLGVLVLCAVAYRRARRAAVVVATLLAGMAALALWMFLGGVKVNFLNFIALPITFGIGADYAVNIYSRYLLERQALTARDAAYRAVASTGGAVALCSLTTVIGYASLLVARNGALISFGELAIIGEIVCFVAAMFFLPAWLTAWPDREGA